MVTKEQERKALDKIKKIVADLGEGSYLSYAFEGCFELAEENIENDFACSPKDKDAFIDRLGEQCELLKEQLDEAQANLSAAVKDCEGWKQLYDNATILYEQQKQEIQDMTGEAIDLNEEIVQLEKALDIKDKEIILLKAKLYDLITK